MSRVVVNGGRLLSHQAPTAPHKLFGRSAQNIGLQPNSNAAFEKTRDPVVKVRRHNEVSDGPLVRDDVATNHYNKKTCHEQAITLLRASSQRADFSSLVTLGQVDLSNSSWRP